MSNNKTAKPVKPTTVYAVFKEGVYRHECAGVFTRSSVARDAAITACTNDVDDYHTYEVVPFALDRPTRQNPLRSPGVSKFLHVPGEGCLVERRPMWRVSRKGDVVTTRRLTAKDTPR